MMPDGSMNSQITPERMAQDRADALVRVRKEIDDIDNEIADLLMRRMSRARYARYMHPDYVDDYDRELQIMAKYCKRLLPWTKKETVADLCMALFKMSRP